MKRDMSLTSMDTDYLNNFFRDAWIHDKKNTRVLSIMRVYEGGLRCVQLDLNDAYHKREWSNVLGELLPLNMLETFSTFSWPKLGYRNFIEQDDSNLVYFFSSQRSTSRGLRSELLSVDPCPVYYRLGYKTSSSLMEGLSQTDKVASIYAPKWVPYQVGMGMLRTGKWAAFAINEDLAISLAVDILNFDGYEILFRGDRVGTISSTGVVAFTDKAVAVKSLRKLLEKELYQ